jgi:hypothetical protein
VGRWTAALVTLLVAGGCSPLTAGEAEAALEEAALVAEGSALMAFGVELGARFTPGAPLETAAEALHASIEATRPCAEVTRTGPVVSVEYGAHPDACDAAGAGYAGEQTITLVRSDAGDVVALHAFAAFRDEAVSIDGAATVSYASAGAARRVVHSFAATRLTDSRVTSVEGEHTQAPSGDDLEAFEASSGAYVLRGEDGEWTLTFDDIRQRFVDPLPEAGRYALDAPFGKQVDLTFGRKGGATLTVVAESGSRTYDFEVMTSEERP